MPLLLRQQMLPMDRLHAIITDGGQVPNIIPERTELSIMVRSKYLETLKEMTSGQNNKTVYLPYEASGVLSSLGGIKELLK